MTDLDFDKSSAFFTAFRQEYGFPYFQRDEPYYILRYVGLWVVSITYILIVLAVTVILAFLGTRGYSRWRVALQMIISLSIGFSIIVAVTGHGWQRSDHEMSTVNDRKEIYTVRMGLHQANITLAVVNVTDRSLIDFHNVKIGWVELDQAEKEYKEALRRGWPLGILRIAQYMSLDMGEMRYMRSFRWSGYIVHILLWFSFATWLLANAILASNISTAAGSLLITGLVQIIACIVYHNQQPDNFYVPLDDGQGTQLRLGYDWMFWLTCFTGIFGVLLSIILLILNYFRPADMNKFFGTHSEILSPYDEELKMNQNKDIKGLIRGISTKRSGAHKKVSIDSEAKTMSPNKNQLKHRRKNEGDMSGYMAEVDTPTDNVNRSAATHMEMKEVNGGSFDAANGEKRNPVEIEIEITAPQSPPTSPLKREHEPFVRSSGSEGSGTPLINDKLHKNGGQETKINGKQQPAATDTDDNEIKEKAEKESATPDDKPTATE